MESSYDPPEGHPGQHAYTFNFKFSVCCYSSYLYLVGFNQDRKSLNQQIAQNFHLTLSAGSCVQITKYFLEDSSKYPRWKKTVHDVFVNIFVQKPAARRGAAPLSFIKAFRIKLISAGSISLDSNTKYVHIYKEYHSVCPPVGNGISPNPLSPASVLLPPVQGGGGHTRLRVRGWGSPIPTTGEKA